MWSSTWSVKGETSSINGRFLRWRVAGGLFIAGDTAACPATQKVSWELAESGEGSRLTFAHTATKSFDTDDPLFSRESCQAGWEYFLNGQLSAFLDKN